MWDTISSTRLFDSFSTSCFLRSRLSGQQPKEFLCGCIPLFPSAWQRARASNTNDHSRNCWPLAVCLVSRCLSALQIPICSFWPLHVNAFPVLKTKSARASWRSCRPPQLQSLHLFLSVERVLHLIMCVFVALLLLGVRFFGVFFVYGVNLTKSDYTMPRDKTRIELQPSRLSLSIPREASLLTLHRIVHAFIDSLYIFNIHLANENSLTDAQISLYASYLRSWCKRFSSVCPSKNHGSRAHLDMIHKVMVSFAQS